MAKIVPQRILQEAIRLLDEFDGDALEKAGIESHEIDNNIEDLELLIQALDKAQIINIETS